MSIELSVLHGQLTLSQFSLRDYGSTQFKEPLTIPAGSRAQFSVTRAKAGGA